MTSRCRPRWKVASPPFQYFRRLGEKVEGNVEKTVTCAGVCPIGNPLAAGAQILLLVAPRQRYNYMAVHIKEASRMNKRILILLAALAAVVLVQVMLAAFI